MSIERAEADLADLKRQRAALDAEIANVEIYIAMARKYEEPTFVEPEGGAEPERPGGYQHVHSTGSSVDDRFRQKSFPDAAYLALEIAGRPMSCPEITKELLKAGMPFAAKSPAQSVFSALKAVERSGRVRRPGRGMWEVVPLNERQEVMPAFPQQVKPNDHSDRTRLGLAQAKERGVQLGVREKLTDSQRQTVMAMITQGKSINETAASIGFSNTGLAKWLRRHDIQRPQGRARWGVSDPTVSPQPSVQSPAAVPGSEHQSVPSLPSDHQPEQTPEPELEKAFPQWRHQ